MTTKLERDLLEAMENAMCGDYCYDLNCSGCRQARLLAMEALVFYRINQRWEQIIAPLRSLATDGLLPKSVVTEITAVTKALKGQAQL